MTISMPPEWALHSAVWSGWPENPDIWGDNLAGARREVGAFFRAIMADGAGEPVHVLAGTRAGAADARLQLAGTAAQIFEIPCDDLWLRDTGPLFALQDGLMVAIAFDFNGWGNKFEHAKDKGVRSAVAHAAGTPTRFFDEILEGGAIDVDGTGRVLTTRACVTNANRGDALTQESFEQVMYEALGLDQVIWLEGGLHEDHTDGHVDNLARFIGPGRVMTMSPSGDDDPNAAVYRETQAALEAAGLEVVLVPSPGLYHYADGSIGPASHMNFYIGNKVVVVPNYGTPWDEAAVEAIAKEFPDRTTIGLPANHILTGGGSFHCITQQQPSMAGGA